MASPASDRFENLQLPTSIQLSGPAENLQITVSQNSRGQNVLSLKGPLSIHTLFKFQEVVRSEFSPGLIVDFGDVPFIDSAGLGAIVAAHVNAHKSDRRILFAAFNGQARTLIEMTHVNDLLETYDTIEDAEDAVVAYCGC